MLFTFLRNLFLFFNCIVVFHKLLRPKPKSLVYKVLEFILPAVLAGLSIFPCKHYTTGDLFLLSLTLLVLFLCPYVANPRTALVTCMISFGISFCMFAFSSVLIMGLVILPIYKMSKYPLNLFITLIGYTQSLLIHLLFKYKRFKNGMPFLFFSTFSNVGTLLGLLSIFIYIEVQNHRPSAYEIQSAYVLAILISLYFLLHWWQSQLTKAYRKRLAQMELESLRTELEQKSILLKKLEAQNEEMGRLIHKDNKLIPAMEHAVSTYLTSDFTDLALQQAQGEALLIDLKELSAARQGILSTFTPAATPKYETGIPSLDAILVYMYQKAQSNGIRFYATATQESLAKCPTKLTNEKLVHILSDLLENAIIATKSSSDKQIQLQIYLANGIFTIEIADTGLSFEPATLISFGLEKASTHLKDGGSGIGLLDIWKIKEEVKASIHIHEYETGTPFSKKIFISFDNRNKYVIHTWRDKELAPLVNRGDLVLLSQNQQTA